METTVSFLIDPTNDSSVFIPEFVNSASKPLLDSDVKIWAETLFHSSLLVFSFLGVVTNGINIRVFIQQGVTSDSNTIGLFALAVADFLSCLLITPYVLCDIVKYVSTASSHESCKYLTGLVFLGAHSMMSRVTCWITVYIAVERCLCVLIPFKVKVLLRPKVAAIAMSVIYVVIVGVYIPWFANIILIKWFSINFNKMMLIVIENRLAKDLGTILSLIFDTILNPAAVVIVAVATTLMLYKLQKYKKWREQSAAAGKGKKETSEGAEVKKPSAQEEKDIKLLRLVLIITGLFLVCSIMSLLPGIAAIFVPGFSISGVNMVLYAILYLYKFLFDLINSSLNFFFYIKISSRYRAAFNEVFRKKSAKK